MTASVGGCTVDLVKNHSQTKNNEWGRKARKAEDHLRGLNHRDARADIAEGLAEQESA